MALIKFLTRLSVFSFVVFSVIKIMWVYVNTLEDTENLLKKTATKSFLEENIKDAITDDNFDRAKVLIDLSKSSLIDVSIEDSVVNEYESKNTYGRKVKDFSSGFIFGDGESFESIAGKISSDFFVIGDIRDLYTESKKLVNGKDVDEFVLGLSIIGVGTSLTANPVADSSLSLLKAGKKFKFLSNDLISSVRKNLKLDDALGRIRKIDISDYRKFEEEMILIGNSVGNSKGYKILQNISSISDNTSSPIDTLRMLKYADDADDVGGLVKLSNKFGVNTFGVLSVLGKKAIPSALGFLYNLSKLATPLKIIISIGLGFFLIVLDQNPQILAILIVLVIAGIVIYFWKSNKYNTEETNTEMLYRINKPNHCIFANPEKYKDYGWIDVVMKHT